MTQPSSTSKRDEILMTAARVIKNKSVSHFTLETVAEEAGISKGGLLYHFPNKNALMQAMVELPLERYKRRVEEAIQRDPNDAGKWSRAYATESIMMDEEMKLLWTSALSAVMALNPKLLDPLRKMHEEWMRLVQDDGIDPLHGAITLLVAEGMWYLDLYQFQGISDDLRKQLLQHLLDITKQS